MRRRGLRIETETRPAHSLQQKLADSTIMILSIKLERIPLLIQLHDNSLAISKNPNRAIIQNRFVCCRNLPHLVSPINRLLTRQPESVIVTSMSGETADAGNYAIYV